MGARILFVAMLWLGASAPAHAQCQLCPAAADNSAAKAKEPTTPIVISIDTELDFSRMIIASAQSGTARIDARSGNRSVAGGLSELGGVPLRGTVRVTGEPRRRVRVSLPGEVQLTAPGGGVARLVDLRTDLSAAPHIKPDGQLEFGFGGTLQVGAGQPGDYRGRIPIAVDYE